MNTCPGYLRIKSTLGGLVNPECGPFSFTECSETTLSDRIIIILLNFRGVSLSKQFRTQGIRLLGLLALLPILSISPVAPSLT